MKIKLLLLISFSTLIFSCVSKTDYDELKTELEQTEKDLSYFKKEYNILLEEKQRIEDEKNRKPFITEEKALSCIKDNYDFYENDTKYRKVKLRRIEDNVFEVSLEECTKKGPFSSDNYFWNSTVRKLTVHSNGKYDF